MYKSPQYTIFLLATTSRSALGYTRSPIQWESEVPSQGVERPGRETDHSYPSSAMLMDGAVPPFPQYVFMARCLIKDRIRLHGVVLTQAQGLHRLQNYNLHSNTNLVPTH